MNITRQWQKVAKIFQDYLHDLFSNESKQTYRVRVVKISYLGVIVMGAASLLITIFAYPPDWRFISYTTQSIQGLVGGIIGFYWSLKNVEQARKFLIPYLIINVLFDVGLSYRDHDFASVTTSVYLLYIPILFSAYISDNRKYIIHSTIATIIGFLALSFLNISFDGIDRVGFSLSVTLSVVSTSALLYFLKRIADINANQLKQANSEIQRLHRTMKHEIRQPIEGLNLLLHSISEAGNSYDLLTIQRAIDSLDLINQVIGNTEAFQFEKQQSQNEMVNLEEVKEHFATIFPSNGIEFSAQFASESRYVNFNKTDLMQIIQNLLSNAKKFTPQGGQILFGIGIVNHILFIATSDTGIGMTNDEQSNIYQLYQKGLASDGEGIGLNIVKQLVTKHGGNINLDSQAGQGTQFLIQIPIEEKVALYFEDEILSRDAMHNVFEQIAGWELHTFEDARNWQQEIANHQPDLVLLDIDMPHISGDAVMEEARSIFPNTIFVAHTANIEDNYIQMFRTLKFDGFIGKPTKPKIIRKCLVRLNADQSLWFTKTQAKPESHQTST